MFGSDYHPVPCNSGPTGKIYKTQKMSKIIKGISLLICLNVTKTEGIEIYIVFFSHNFDNYILK